MKSGASIVHYPKHYGGRQWRKDVTDTVQRTDDRKQVLDQQVPVTPSKRKDTRRWCRGKVGVEHQVEWVQFALHFLKETCWYKHCAACKKKFDYEFRPSEVTN